MAVLVVKPTKKDKISDTVSRYYFSNLEGVSGNYLGNVQFKFPQILQARKIIFKGCLRYTGYSAKIYNTTSGTDAIEMIKDVWLDSREFVDDCTAFDVFKDSTVLTDLFLEFQQVIMNRFSKTILNQISLSNPYFGSGAQQLTVTAPFQSFQANNVSYAGLIVFDVETHAKEL